MVLVFFGLTFHVCMDSIDEWFVENEVATYLADNVVQN